MPSRTRSSNQAGIIEPRGRLVGQALHPRVGRVNVFEAEPPDGRRLEKAGDIPICGTSLCGNVEEPGKSVRVRATRGERHLSPGGARTRARQPPCCCECSPRYGRTGWIRVHIAHRRWLGICKLDPVTDREAQVADGRAIVGQLTRAPTTAAPAA